VHLVGIIYYNINTGILTKSKKEILQHIPDLKNGVKISYADYAC
jgi:hypothetical protein